MNRKTDQDSPILISCLRAQIVWLVVSSVLLLAFCAIAYGTKDPDSITRPLSLCALYIGALAAGIAAVRFSCDGIVSGAISGIFTCALLFLFACLPLPESGFDTSVSLVLSLAVIPVSILGSIIGHRRESGAKKQKMMHKKMKR